MAPWRCDPYLWIHLAGLATVPLWIDLCMLGLAVGNPTVPDLELGVIAALGVLPVLVMQLRQPFYIFSLPGLALRPTALQADQRRLLTQFRRWRVRLGALLVPVPLVWGLLKLYPLAFLARDLTPFDDWGRLGGVAIAALSFLMANLFLQIPVAVLQVLATPSRTMAGVSPYPVEAIAADFTWVGLPVGKILPDLAPRKIPEVAAPASAPVKPVEAMPTVDFNPDPEARHDPEDRAESQPFQEHRAEAIEAEASMVRENASELSDALSEALIGAVNLDESEDAALGADSIADDPAVGEYRPLMHPEVDDESDQAVAYLAGADYPQPSPAIADLYPNSR